jgi:hypothetical protein
MNGEMESIDAGCLGRFLRVCFNFQPPAATRRFRIDEDSECGRRERWTSSRGEFCEVPVSKFAGSRE